MSVRGNDEAISASRSEALVEHYQKTFDLVMRFWERRNRLFLVLTGVLALAGILSILERPITALVQAAILHQIAPADAEAVREIQIGVPQAFKLLIASLVVAIFYLMANLYHRTGSITSLYVYLAELEQGIRRELNFSESDPAFTREGKFYRSTGFRMSRLIGMSYKAVLGALLLAFFALRFWHDGPEALAGWRAMSPGGATPVAGWLQEHFLFLLEVLVSIPAAIFFFGYVTLTASKGMRELMPPAPEKFR